MKNWWKQSLFENVKAAPKASLPLTHRTPFENLSSSPNPHFSDEETKTQNRSDYFNVHIWIPK